MADILTLAQSKKYTNMVALGLSDVSVKDTTVTFTLNDGEKASVTLPTPKDGAPGPAGEKGIDGANGKDAYTIAVEEGFRGTRKEWLDSLKGQAGAPTEIGNIPITGDLIPDANGAYSIGSEDKKLKAIHAEEIYMSANTLYIDGTPVFHTNDNDDILVSADEDQSINVKTTGIANTNVLSEQAVQIKTTKEASNVNICAGDVTNGSTSNVNIHASNNISEICNNQITQKAPYIVEEAANGVSIRGGLNVDSLTVVENLVVKGETFKVEATDMEVKDNIITINKGESGSGVSKGTAGIRIDRGDAPAYNIIFDEADDMFKIGEDNRLETITTQEHVNALLGEYATRDEIYIPGNKQTLDRLSESSDGQTLLFNGQEIKGGGGSGETVVNTILWDDYSTNEICIGCWTDGKPIYRKVVTGTTSDTANTWVYSQSKIANMDSLVNLCGTLVTADGAKWALDSVRYNEDFTKAQTSVVNITSGGFVGVLATGSSWLSRPFVVIVEYTKTTDAENSFDVSKLSTVSLQLQATDEDVEEVLS